MCLLPPRFRRHLGVLGALAGTAAYAQDAPRPAAVPLEEVVVYGQRLAQQRALDRRRAATRFIDAVSADDLGRLPDRNLAEALDRLAGVSLTVDQGEGRFVAIRGLNSSLNNFTVNGMPAGTPEAEGGGRRVPLDVIGDGLLEAVEIIKVQTPDMDAQGVGGTINLVTAVPFDYLEGPHARVSVQAGYDQLNHEQPHAGELTVGAVDDSGTWGWLLGAAHSYRRSEARGIHQDDWAIVATDDGEAASVPESTRSVLYDLQRRRTGVNAALEWHPSPEQRHHLRAFFSELEEHEIRQRFAWFFRNHPLTLIPPTGSANENHRDVDLRVEHKHKRFLNAALGGEFGLERWQLDYVAQVNDNAQDLPSRTWEWRARHPQTDRWIIDDGGLVDVTGGVDRPLDPAGFEFLRLRTRELVTEERSHIAAINVRYAAELEASYVKIGAKYARTERDHDADLVTHAPGTTVWTLAGFGHYGGTSNLDIRGVRRPLISVDARAANAFFDAQGAGGTYFALDERATFSARLTSDYGVKEEILAGYAMANWAFDRGSVLAGVRVENTGVHSRGWRLNPERAVATPATSTGSHTSLLPGVLARFDVTPQLVLRTAWTRTLGRPNYEQLAPTTLLTREGDTGFLELGNPDLEARESTNYDIGLEWYFAPDGVLAARAYHKRIANEIVDRFRAYDDFVFDDETFERFIVTTRENAEQSEASGIELSYQQQFAFLPEPFDGLGLALSYAALDSATKVTARHDEMPLARQPDWTRSGSLFYQKAGFEFALSFAQADAYLAEVSDSPQTDLYAGAYGRLDLLASYTFRDRYRLFFEWLNVGREPSSEYQGGLERQATQYEIHGQTWYLGLAARL